MPVGLGLAVVVLVDDATAWRSTSGSSSGVAKRKLLRARPSWLSALLFLIFEVLLLSHSVGL